MNTDKHVKINSYFYLCVPETVKHPENTINLFKKANISLSVFTYAVIVFLMFISYCWANAFVTADSARDGSYLVLSAIFMIASVYGVFYMRSIKYVNYLADYYECLLPYSIDECDDIDGWDIIEIEQFEKFYNSKVCIIYYVILAILLLLSSCTFFIANPSLRLKCTYMIIQFVIFFCSDRKYTTMVINNTLY